MEQIPGRLTVKQIRKNLQECLAASDTLILPTKIPLTLLVASLFRTAWSLRNIFADTLILSTKIPLTLLVASLFRTAWSLRNIFAAMEDRGRCGFGAAVVETFSEAVFSPLLTWSCWKMSENQRWAIFWLRLGGHFWRTCLTCASIIAIFTNEACPVGHGRTHSCMNKLKAS